MKKNQDLEFVIGGKIDKKQCQKLSTIVCLLQKITGDTTINTNYLDEGNIRLILRGSEQGLQKLQELFDLGQLEDLLNQLKSEETPQIFLKNVQFTKKSKIKQKSQLIKDIRNNIYNKDHLGGANLGGANLGGANLSGANLSWTNLSGANLVGADLSWANLVGANLVGANLVGANLILAFLDEADLRDADLSKTNLSRVNVINTIFSNTKGVNDMKDNLIERGAIFDDSPEDKP